MCSGICQINPGVLRILQNSNAWPKSGLLKYFRKYSTINKSSSNIQTLHTFRYQYESNELIEKLKVFTKNNSAEKFPMENVLLCSSEPIIQSKDDVQMIVTATIMAAKTGQSVENFRNSNLSKNVVQKFLDFLERSPSCIDSMSADETVECLIALNLLKIPMYHPVNRKLMTLVSSQLRGKSD